MQLSALLFFSHSVVKSVCEKRLEMVVQRGSGYSECCVCKAICYLKPRTSPPPFQWLPSCPQISRPMRPESQSAHAARWQPRDSGSACLASPLPHPESFSVSLYPLPPPSWLPLFRVTVMNGHARLMAVCGWLEQPPFFLITDPVAVISCIISLQRPLAPLRLLWAIIAIILEEWERLDAGNSHYDLRVLRRRLVSGKHKQQVNAKRN